MRKTEKVTQFILPVVVVSIVIHGGIKGIPVFETFTEGAKKGLATVVSVLPSYIALIAAVNMLRSSGGLEVLCNLLSPLSSLTGIPKDVLPITILSPVSGGGALGLYEALLKTAGPDSASGRIASVIMGSTETTFYAIALYFGSLGIKKTRHTLPCALSADIVSYLLSPIAVTLF